MNSRVAAMGESFADFEGDFTFFFCRFWLRQGSVKSPRAKVGTRVQMRLASAVVESSRSIDNRRLSIVVPQ
jgi:hypothetical protein